MIDISNKHETQEVETEGLSLGRIISLLSCCYIPFLLIVLISIYAIGNVQSSERVANFDGSNQIDFYQSELKLLPENKFFVMIVQLIKMDANNVLNFDCDMKLSLERNLDNKLIKQYKEIKEKVRFRFKESTKRSNPVMTYSLNGILPGTYTGKMRIYGNFDSIDSYVLKWYIGNPAMHWFYRLIKSLYLIYVLIILLSIFTSWKYIKDNVSGSFNSHLEFTFSFFLYYLLDYFLLNNNFNLSFMVLLHFLLILFFKQNLIKTFSFLKINRKNNTIAFKLICASELFVHLLRIKYLQQIDQVEQELLTLKIEFLFDIILSIFLSVQILIMYFKENIANKSYMLVYSFNFLIYIISNLFLKFNIIKKDSFNLFLIKDIFEMSLQFAIIFINHQIILSNTNTFEEYSLLTNNQNNDNDLLLSD